MSYCGNCARLEAEVSVLHAQRYAAEARAEKAERERDEVIAHDRQPYPTAWAYEQACKALHAHEARAEKAERVADNAATVMRLTMESVAEVCGNPVQEPSEIAEALHVFKSYGEVQKQQRDAAEKRLRVCEAKLREVADHLVKMKDGAHNCAMCGNLYREIDAALAGREEK